MFFMFQKNIHEGTDFRRDKDKKNPDVLIGTSGVRVTKKIFMVLRFLYVNGH